MRPVLHRVKAVLLKDWAWDLVDQLFFGALLVCVGGFFWLLGLLLLPVLS